MFLASFWFFFAHVYHPVGGRSMGNANGGVFLREGVWPWWRRMGERGGQEVDGDGEPESADGKPVAKSFLWIS